MQKTDLLQQIAYANVPQGSRKVSQDSGDGLILRKLNDPGARAIVKAQMIHHELVASLASLPDEVTGSHQDQVATVITKFFDIVEHALMLPALKEMLNSDREKYLRKLGELLPKS